MKTQDAIDFFGSRNAIADALGIDRTATYHWGDTVPELRQYQIQVLSNGKLVADQPEQERG
jgi:transcriptional repressor of cell division inhibition gene dicB